MAEDPFDLRRFVEAQAGVYETALGELLQGRKRSHWMWFIFPQLRGLGHSSMAQHYGIASLDEARAYLAHPLLGPRLERVTQAVLATGNLSLADIFGAPDDMKFRSSMTLFDAARPDTASPYRAALARWFGGAGDAATLERLRSRDR